MKALTAEMIVDAVVPGSLSISPDGRWIAFRVAAVGYPDVYRYRAIWLVTTDGEQPARQFTDGLANDCLPSWALDGLGIFVLSDRAKRGNFQIYRHPLDGSKATALTDWEPGIESFIPLRDGKAIAFLATVAESEEEKTRRDERDDAEVYGERWPWQRLHLLDLETRAVAMVDALGDRQIVEAVSSADGSRIAVLAWPTPEQDNLSERGEILIVDRARGAVFTVCQLPSGGWGLVWGSGEEEMLYVANSHPGYRGARMVFAVASTGGEPRPLHPELAACVEEVAVSGDGTPFVLIADGLDTWVGRLDMATGALERVQDMAGNAWSLAVSDHGKTIATVRSTRDDFADIWAGPDSGELRRLTRLNPTLDDVAWGSQQPVRWRAQDDLEIEGLLILPPGKSRQDGPSPLMTLVHGGPYGRFADEFQIGASRWGQWLALSGYAILLPNPRGGKGRGDDFADRVSGAVGQEDWGDIEAGIDHLIGEGIADRDRLGIGGWSQGGFMTAWAVGQTRRFKVGIMGAGVSHWGMMAATSDMPSFDAMLGGSTPWDGIGPHRADALSPISFARHVTTPLLILHGADDAWVPVSQAKLMAQALRATGVPHELVIYPREPHGIGERNHQLDMLRRVRAWVGRWLGEG